MDGCFSVYVLNTTEALFLFFRQRNLNDGMFRGAVAQRQKEKNMDEMAQMK